MGGGLVQDSSVLNSGLVHI